MLAHFQNEKFKIWALKHIHNNTRLITIHHGGGAFYRYNGIMLYDREVSDRYISTGYKNLFGNKTKPLGQFFNHLKYGKYNRKGLALLVSVAMPRYSFDLRSMVIAGQMIEYFNDQFKFYENLTNNVKNQLKVRLYNTDYGWSQKQRWLDHFPEVQFDKNRKMNVSIRQSRLMIGTYASTTYNETLASNIPTIIFWNTKHWELSKVSDPFFQELKRVGIFHLTPESAAKQVVKIWDDIDTWWYGLELQKVRKNYCLAFAYKPKNLIEGIKDVLVQEKMKCDAEQEYKNCL